MYALLGDIADDVHWDFSFNFSWFQGRLTPIMMLEGSKDSSRAKVARFQNPGGNPFDLRVRSMNSGMEESTGVAKPTPEEDGELLTRVLRGDERAMAVLFDRYSKIVYSVSLRVLRDTASAEDVMQEIFMQIWRNPSSFVSTKGSLGGWLASQNL